MKDLGKNIIEKIEKEKVAPYSKWHFIYRRSVIWGVAIISVVLGGIATGTAIFQIKNSEWDIYRHLGHSTMEFFLLVLPYFWIGFMVVFAVFTYYYFVRTERGYKYSFIIVILGSLALSGVLGGILSFPSFPETLHIFFEDNVSIYRQMEMHRHHVWMNPSNGVLAGTIRDAKDGNFVRFEDLNGNFWDVDIRSAVFRGQLVPETGIKIKMMGRMEDDTHFVADEVRPWQGKRRHGHLCTPSEKLPGKGNKMREKHLHKKNMPFHEN